MARPPDGYRRDGIRIVSVTEALSMSRVRRWRGSPADWDRRRAIGSAVHQATAILDCNKTTWDAAPWEWLEDLAQVSPEVERMTKAWEKFKVEQLFRPRLIEHSMFAKTGVTDFATTIDREGLIGTNGIPVICEIKTPKVKEPYWGVQMAGQELALLSNFGPPKERPMKYARIVTQLFATGDYKVTLYDDPIDRDVFLWALGLSVWNRNHYGD